MAPNKTTECHKLEKTFDQLKESAESLVYDNQTPGYTKFFNNIPRDEVISTPRLFLFSGFTTTELKRKLHKFLKEVEGLSPESLRDLKTSEIDDNHLYRHCILAGDKSQLIELLKNSGNEFKTIQRTNGKLAFLMTSQGFQYPCMGRTLYETSQKFRDEFDACAKIIEEEFPGMGGFRHLIFEEEDVSWTKQPEVFLPYTLALEYALFKFLREGWGLRPTHIMGLGFGDYVSALIAGIITFKDAVKLVMNRCILMTENIKEEAFLVMEISVEEFDEMLDQIKVESGMEEVEVYLANKNSPNQTCIVGKEEYLQKFHDLCKSKGKDVMLNPHTLPYHSKLASPVAPAFAEVTASVNYGKTTRMKFVSSLDGEVKTTVDPKYFVDHLVSPVNTIDAIETLLRLEGVTNFVEIGPHPLFPPLLKDILASRHPENPTKYSIMRTLCRKEDDRVALLNLAGKLYMAGFNMKWDNFKELEL